MYMRRLTLVLASLLTPAILAAQELPVIRAAVLQIGTVNWELATIEAEGFDKAAGFDLSVQPFADNGATRVALEGGEADLAVADWIWVARQRAEGRDYVFVPYSRAVGSLVVPDGSPAQSIEDLRGGKIGIAGGPLDKSWLILRAYAEEVYGFDLKAETEQVFGAPPLIFKTALSGETEGAINFWHFLAKMKASGMRELVSVETAARELGLDVDTPLLGYVMKGSFLDAHPGIAQKLYAASRAAKALLSGQGPEAEAAWERLRPTMNADDDAQFEALKAGWIEGIPQRGPVNEIAAAKMLALMAELGGPDLVGKAGTLPEGLFVPLE